jgi:3-methyladenine DNA glycosylase/8-oxoguanine DNA glycosylase
MCVRVVLGQQVSVKGAHTIMGRLSALCLGFQPADIAEADLRSIGLTEQRSRTVRALAEAAATGTLRFDRPWPEIAEVLRGIKGIGPWTIAYLAIRLGRDPDSFPETDLGLLRASGATSPKALLEIAESWRPFRSHAALYLWTVEPE